jgi:hypothetical protein
MAKKVIKKTITAKTTLAKIIEKKDAAGILAKNGVPCLSCPMAQFEIDELEIGKVCKMYGLNIKKILKELNK